TATKMAAYNEVKQAAAAKKATNGQTTNATDEEVAEASQAVDTAQTEGIKEIQGVKTNQEVADKKTEVINRINAIQPAVRVKPEAETAIENAYNIRKQEIQNSNA
ncbi:DUF1542 domain-containing protein, partial [Pseudomonas aeruginosa]